MMNIYQQTTIILAAFEGNVSMMKCLMKCLMNANDEYKETFDWVCVLRIYLFA